MCLDCFSKQLSRYHTTMSAGYGIALVSVLLFTLLLRATLNALVDQVPLSLQASKLLRLPLTHVSNLSNRKKKMRFKISLARESKHKDFATAVGWSTSDELLSVGDDHQLLRWQLATGEHVVQQLAVLPENVYATDLHFYPRGLGGAGAGTDLFVLSSAEGKFYLISKSGRVEKAVDAHHGAVLSIRWSYDGASLLTVGEDGSVKIWSRNGMLRSTLSQNSGPVYSGCWASDNNQVLYCCGQKLTIKPLQANAKPNQWKAHDGLILSADWCPSSNLIVSGGEDCKYRVWDNYGRQLYVSGAHEFPITDVNWSFDGQLFTVASFNTLRLCDKAGWCYSLDKPQTGSILNVAWSPDGMQVAGACSNGHIIFASVVDKRAEWRQMEAVQTKTKTIEIRDATNVESRDKLELRDRIVKFALGYNHVIVATSNQCYIYNSKNWNTPIIFDLKEGSVSLILLSPSNFLLVGGGSIHVYEYGGRLQSTIKYSGMRADLLNEKTTSLSADTLSVRDKVDEKRVYLFDLENSGKPIGDGKITHTQEIMEIALDQCGPSNERKLAFIDKNNDVFLCQTRVYGAKQKIAKLGTMVRNIQFNDSTNMLVGLQDNKLIVWSYPSAAFIDKELLPRTIITKESSTDFGKHPSLVSFLGNHITVRRSDGSLITMGIPPFAATLLGYAEKSKWDDALRLCRHVRDENLWATLAAVAAYARNLNTAEIAYAAINEAEKVQYLAELRRLGNKDVRNAEMASFCGNIGDSESSLLQGGHIFRAIMLSIMLYKWDRALELATKHKCHMDVILAYRQRYLEELGKKETNSKFLQLASENDIDWDTVQEKVEREYQKEKTK